MNGESSKLSAKARPSPVNSEKSPVSGFDLRLHYARWPWLRHVLGVILLFGGIAFVARTLRGQFTDLATAAITIQAWTYPVTTLLATLTVLVTACLHEVVIEGMTPNPVDPARVRYAYAASQVARYVPGKVFGVILETQMLAPAIGMRLVVVATLVQTLLIYAWACILAVIAMATIATGSVQLAALAPLGLFALWMAQRNRWLERLRLALTTGADATTQSTERSRRSAWKGTLLLVVQWVPFFAIWILLAAPTQGIAAAFWLGASYLLASIGGSLLVLVPSGLVVRESAFVWLGMLYGLPAPELVAWAVVARLALTLADVLAVPLLWAHLQTGKRA